MADSQTKPMSAINISGPAEMLRMEQKDKELCEQICQQLSEMLVKFKGHIFVNKNQQHIFSTSQLLYYALTTLSKLQTMGEEYTRIIQVGKTGKHTPGLLQSIGMILAHVFGEQLIALVLDRFIDCVRDNKSITLQAKTQIINSMAIIKSLVPLLQSLNKVLFYWNGSFYTWAKRLFNIRYIYAVPWYSPKRPLHVFKILSVLTAIQLSIHIFNTVFKVQNLQINESNVNEYSGELHHLNNKKICLLCLEPRKNTSLTFCGHLFCWFCIHKWLQTRDECPICRKTLDPRKIVPLQNVN